jgi:glycosyltransferase involved in cell wall biosynthesis
MIEWTRGLLARGVDVTPVILRAPSSLRAVAEREGLPFVFLQRSSFDVRTVTDFLSLIGQRGIQVLHLQGHGSSTFGRLAARRARLPAIVHVHADYRLSPKGYPWYVRAADRALAPRTALALTVTEQLIPFMIGDQGFRREQIEVLRNPVDLERFRPATEAERLEARASLGVAPNAHVVTALGRLDRLKGIDVLLEAWRGVAAVHDSAVLLLAGDGPERSSLERMVERLRLPRVRFLGQRADVRPVLWASDVLAMPSRYEAMPMAALEALACGVPVAGSRAGGIPDIVCDGENGLLVPVEDGRALADALTGVMADEARRRSLAAGALRLIQPYGLTSFVATLEARYAELAGGRGRGDERGTADTLRGASSAP